MKLTISRQIKFANIITFFVNILVFNQVYLMVVSIHYKKLCVLIKFAVVSLKGNSYRIYFWVMIKDEAMDWIKKDDFNLKSGYKYK